jgi:hypothetical protein
MLDTISRAGGPVAGMMLEGGLLLLSGHEQ